MKIVILFLISTSIQAFEWPNLNIKESIDVVKSKAESIYSDNEKYVNQLKKKSLDPFLNKFNSKGTFNLQSNISNYMQLESNFVNTLPMDTHINKFFIIKPYVSLFNNSIGGTSFDMINVNGFSNGSFRFPMASPAQTQQLFYKLKTLKNNVSH